jgi:hypothetical protein
MRVDLAPPAADQEVPWVGPPTGLDCGGGIEFDPELSTEQFLQINALPARFSLGLLSMF